LKRTIYIIVAEQVKLAKIYAQQASQNKMLST